MLLRVLLFFVPTAGTASASSSLRGQLVVKVAGHFAELLVIPEVSATRVCPKVLSLRELLFVVRLKEDVGSSLILEIFLLAVRVGAEVAEEREDSTTAASSCPRITVLELHGLVEELGLTGLVTGLGCSTCARPNNLVDGAGVAAPGVVAVAALQTA